MTGILNIRATDPSQFELTPIAGSSEEMSLRREAPEYKNRTVKNWFLKNCVSSCCISDPQTNYEIGIEHECEREELEALKSYGKASASGHKRATFKLGRLMYQLNERFWIPEYGSQPPYKIKVSSECKSYWNKRNEAEGLINKAARDGIQEATDFLRTMESDLRDKGGRIKAYHARIERDRLNAERLALEEEKRREWERNDLANMQELRSRVQINPSISLLRNNYQPRPVEDQSQLEYEVAKLRKAVEYAAWRRMIWG
jgi:hypothetical protein